MGYSYEHPWKALDSIATALEEWEDVRGIHLGTQRMLQYSQNSGQSDRNVLLHRMELEQARLRLSEAMKEEVHTHIHHAGKEIRQLAGRALKFMDSHGIDDVRLHEKNCEFSPSTNTASASPVHLWDRRRNLDACYGAHAVLRDTYQEIAKLDRPSDLARAYLPEYELPMGLPRWASARDIPQMMDCMEVAVDDTQTRERKRNEIRSLMMQPDASMLVTEHNDSISACFAFSRNRSQLIGEQLHVHPDFAGKGLESQMVGLQIRLSRKYWRTRISQIVAESDLPLLNMLKEQGYMAQGLLRGYGDSTDGDGIVMQYRLPYSCIEYAALTTRGFAVQD